MQLSQPRQAAPWKNQQNRHEICQLSGQIFPIIYFLDRQQVDTPQLAPQV